MLEALVGGERDPEVLAELARGVLRKKRPLLRQALKGRFSDHHGLLVGLSLAHLEHLERAISQLDQRVDQVIAAFAAARDRLDTITGVGKRAAETIIAEIGTDMGVFPTAAIWRRGRVAALATTSPAASAARASPQRQPLAGRGADLGAPGPLPAAATPTWPPSSGGWPDASATRRPPAPLATRSW
jgi:transposase